ncbi:JANA protein, partial [Acromyrmex charruanus]
MNLSSVESSENAETLLVRTIVIGQTILVNLRRPRRNDQVNELDAFVVATITTLFQWSTLLHAMLAILNMKSKGRTKCDMHDQRLSLKKVVTQLARQSCETSTSLYSRRITAVSVDTHRARLYLPCKFDYVMFMHCIRKLKSVSTNERAIFFTTAITVRSIVIFLSDIFDEVDEQIKKHAGLQANCVGGGRIEHDPDEKTIKVYGYSQGFGKADHQVSVDLLKKKYPDYNITCSDEGY